MESRCWLGDDSCVSENFLNIIVYFYVKINVVKSNKSVKQFKKVAVVPLFKLEDFKKNYKRAVLKQN